MTPPTTTSLRPPAPAGAYSTASPPAPARPDGRVVVGLIAIAVAALVVAVVFFRSPEPYTVRIEFSDAAGVRKNSDVKISQIKVGTVTDVGVNGADNAILTATLDPAKGIEQIGAGASAEARPVNLLGEKYVDLDPGDVTRPLPSGALIPATRTATAVELDQVLNTLDPTTRGLLRILINESGAAMTGRGDEFGELLDQLPPGLGDARRALTALAEENRSLGGLIEDGERIASAVAPKRDELAALIVEAERALSVTADQRDQIGQTLRAAPSALDELTATLHELDAAAVELRPAASDLERAAPPLRDTLAALPSFASDAEGSLVAARRVAPALERLGAKGTPTVRRLNPTSQRLDGFAAQLRGVVDMLDDGGIERLLRFVDGWGQLSDRTDGLGHVFRVRLFLDESAFRGAISKYLGRNMPPETGRTARVAERRGGVGSSVDRRDVGPSGGGGDRAADPPPAAPRPEPPVSDRVAEGSSQLLDFLLGP